MSEHDEVVGHCGRVFLAGQVCDEVKWDDLCQGCCMNDEEEQESEEEWG